MYIYVTTHYHFISIKHQNTQMPFRSRSQLRTCFSRQLQAQSQNKPFNWDCEKWLSETTNPDCLPEGVGLAQHRPCRRAKANEPVIGPVYTGERGGLYFFAKGQKVYVPKGTEKPAIKRFGWAKGHKGSRKGSSKKKSSRKGGKQQK